MATKKKSKLPKKTATLSDIQAQLNAIRQQVAYYVVRLAPAKEEEWHPIVIEAEATLENE